MTHADRLQQTPATFRRLTGITPAAFRRLLGEVTAADYQVRTRRASRPGRRRKAGAGRKPALPLADQLLMLLVYYRTYVPHTFLGFLFGLDDSNVSRTNRRLEPLLAGVFRIPERRVELTEEEIRELFFDSTERPTARPVRGQKRYYSGKKRRHTLKTQVVVVRVRKRPGRGRERRRVRIAAVSPTFPGSVHDKKVFDRVGAVIPAGATGYGDTAYLGTGLRTPRRKPPKGQLTRRQKAGNRRVGSKRVVVEHGIGKLKVWRVAAERWRNPRRRHTLVMKNVAGLHNRMFAE
jgi:DDE superfamily endonuclease/Helix-turn-helix of DDE superfamily endonuclease